MKKNLLSLAAGMLLMTASYAEGWKLDASHSKIKFKAAYLLITDTEGDFKKFDGTFTSAKADWTDLKATIAVDVNSINTENEMRDGHLKGDDFFNAEKYPQIKFESTSVKKIGDKQYVLNGNLTIRDVTKAVSLPVVFNGMVKDPWGNMKAGFKSTGKINRQDYGLKYSGAAGTGEAVVSDEIEFTVDLVLIKQ
jgi:polyisoprenoid-binding protein YceI